MNTPSPDSERIFWVDPYMTQLSTRVARREGPWVVLAETILFAESGGQESDHGQIDCYPVLEAVDQGRSIAYRLAGDHALNVAQPVEVSIDWERRYRLMRLHFAAELVLEIVTQAHSGVEKIGAHISALRARIDFASGENVAAWLSDINARVGAIVAADLPIQSAFSDSARLRRFWRIDGFAEVPCGGTHLKRTGEVGELALRRRNVGRGKERIEMALAAP